MTMGGFYSEAAMNDYANHWGQSYIKWVNDAGLISVDESGRFLPDQAISREEFIIALNQLMHREGRYDKIDFILYQDAIGYTDVATNEPLYYDISELNIYIKYYSDVAIQLSDIFTGTLLQPGKSISRYEAALLARAVITPPIDTRTYTFKDVGTALPHYTLVMEQVNSGIIKGYSDQRLRLFNPVTRAEAAVILQRIQTDFKLFYDEALAFKPITQLNPGKAYPLFFLPNGGTAVAAQNQAFIDAVASLEYIGFVGFIPYSEQHLYDTKPVETLWQLKNQDYDNVLGVNYYLLTSDKNIGNPRRVELIQEGMIDLLALKQEPIEGLDLFLKEAQKHLVTGLFEENLLTLYKETTNFKTRQVAALFLGNLYGGNGNFEQSIPLYQELLTSGLTGDPLYQGIKNYAYLLYQHQGPGAAASQLRALEQQLAKGEGGLDQQAKELIMGLLKRLSVEQRVQ